jgi:hypothetical protein
MPAKPSEFATRDSATVTDTDKFIGIDPESTTGVGAGPAGQPFTILASELAEYVGAEIGTLTTETIQDTMSTTLVEGTDIDITYNDTTGTITIASSAAVTTTRSPPSTAGRRRSAGQTSSTTTQHRPALARSPCTRRSVSTPPGRRTAKDSCSGTRR